MYVRKANTAGVNSPAEFASGTKAGTWVAINVRDITKAGTTGYDALGYKNDSTLRTEADSLGAFSFSSGRRLDQPGQQPPAGDGFHRRLDPRGQHRRRSGRCHGRLGTI